LWAFDLSCDAGCDNSDVGGGSGSDPGDPYLKGMDVAFLTSSTGGGGPPVAKKPIPLYTAKDEDGNIQPITVRPAIARNTAATGDDPNIMVMFGTGQYHASGDSSIPVTSRMNSFYGIRDTGDPITTNDRDEAENANDAYDTIIDGDPSATASAVAGFNADTDFELVRQELDDSVAGFRTISSYPVDWSVRKGWYIDLEEDDSPNAEERVVVNPTIRSDIVFFNTLIPNAEVCGYGGSGWLMSVDFLTGTASSSTIFDATGNGIIDASDNINGSVAVGQAINSIPANSSFIGDYQYTQGSDESINKRKINVAKGLREGRLSWRELRDDN